jgi:integrase
MAQAQVLFNDVARGWWERHMLQGNVEYAGQAWRKLEREVFPSLGDKPLKKITAPMILTILRRVEARGTLEVAHKLKSHISQIMRYGIACGMIYSNPARDLSWALHPKKSIPRPALTDPREIGRLMAGIERMRPGVKRCALKLLAFTFVRSAELRCAEWSEIQWDSAEWRIPAPRMKMKRAHIVPLSRQALEVLRELRSLGKSDRWLFPAFRRHEGRQEDQPMTASVLRKGIQLLGFGQEEMCPHGCRAMAATTLSEQGWPSEIIERQLAHVDRNQVRAAYQRSELLTERRKMMQAWADFLDMRCAWAILGK